MMALDTFVNYLPYAFNNYLTKVLFQHLKSRYSMASNLSMLQDLKKNDS